MTIPPWLIVSLLVTLAFALTYQTAVQKFGWRIAGYWMVIFIGFMAGELASEALGWNMTRLGNLRVLPDLVGAGLAATLLWFFGV